MLDWAEIETTSNRRCSGTLWVAVVQRAWETRMSCDEIKAALEVGHSVAGGCFVEVEGDLLQGHVVGCFRC